MSRKVLMTSTPWHPGYPFRPRGGKVRRVGSVLTLACLSALIGGYWYVTDSRRVRAIAEHYLTEAVGGKVTVGRARLSIFEGLRLDDVKVSVSGPPAPDSTLLTAATLHVRVPLADALQGDLSGATILAVEPRVYLVSDATTKTWNFQRLTRPAPTTRTTEARQPRRITLPQVILRGGRLQFAELVDGKVVRGEPAAVEGNLIPDKDKDALYTFALSARGASDQAGFSLTGWTYLPTGQISARLRNVDLGGSFAAILPRQVREWWERHEIAGKIEIPEISVGPAGADGKGMSFKVVTSFERGALSLRPEDLRISPPTTRPTTAPTSQPSSPEVTLLSPPKPTTPPPPGGRLRPIRFEDVRGELIFTDDGIQLNNMSLVYEDSKLGVSGSLGGYTPGSPFSLKVHSDNLQLRENPAFVPSLPPEVREVYDRFLPSGTGNFAFSVARDISGRLSTDGRLNITRGKMTFDRFAFPVHDITGSIVVSQIAPGQTRLEVVDIRGRGRADGPNATADLRVHGFMFPLEGGSEVNFSVRGDNVVADDELVAAMPDGVREVLRLFDPAGKTYPPFGGSFTTEVYRAPGPISRWKWPIDVQLAHASGRFEPFPYPLDNVTGRVMIRSGFVDLEKVTTARGNARLVVDGRVTYGDQPPGKLLYDLTLDGRAVPIDDTLIQAIPATKRHWLIVLGLGGNIDLTGKVTGQDARYDLNLTLRDGTLRPKSSTWIATAVSGEMNLTPTSLSIKNVKGDRLGSPIAAAGDISWATGDLSVTLNATAKNLPFDPDLRSVLDPSERIAWDAVKPVGNADVSIRLSPELGTVYSIAPLSMSATPSVLPVRLDNVLGTLVISGRKIELNGLTANRGNTSFALNGTADIKERIQWDVTLSARNLLVDEELRSALPAMLRTTASSVSLLGRANVDFKKFLYVSDLTPDLRTPNASQPAPPPPGTTPATKPGQGTSVDFDVSVEPLDVTFSLGVPVRATGGRLDLIGSVRDDRLSTLSGSFILTSGQMASRDFINVRAGIEKTADQQGLKLTNLTGGLADGEFSGYAAIAFPDDGTTRYGVDLSLRNADVALLVGKVADTDLSGRMSASLTLQGNADDPRSRRGRGDISVTGEKMARVPVLLGLIQIANLTLPGGTSFNNATARYNMDGPKVTFEQLVLRSPGLQIDGAGSIDMDSRQVRLTLWTTPEGGLRLPLFSDFVDRTRRELLQITIKGTIENPKIGANSFDSFTTTVEEVFKSSGRNDREQPPKK